MKQHQWLLILALAVSLLGCNLKIASNKNTQNTKDIGIETVFGYKANNVYKDTVEASVANVISKFNQEKHAFKVHKRMQGEADYLTLDFSRIKIVGKGHALATYLITGTGLFVAPFAVYALSSHTFTLAYYYIPFNRILYTASLSPDLNATDGVSKNYFIETSMLFRNKQQRIDITQKRFEAKLYETLTELEKQLKKH